MSYTLSAEAAEFYESTFVPGLFASWAQRLVDAAEPAPGESVLDVACGTGAVARHAAGRAAVVVGLDANEAMLAVARRLRPDLRWQAGDAGALPYGDGEFDVVLCQAALMFFPDRVRALREMGRVAADRVAVQVPGRLAESPGYLALTEVVARHAGPEAVELITGYFSVGEPDLLTGLCATAGLRIDRWESWLSATRLPGLDEFLAAELLPLAGRVDRDVRARITADCRTDLARFIDPSGAIAAPLEAHLLIARPQ